MNKYQNELYGQRATPDFEGELCFLIQLDTDFLRIEDCSENSRKRLNSSGERWDIEVRVTNAGFHLAKWGDLK